MATSLEPKPEESSPYAEAMQLMRADKPRVAAAYDLLNRSLEQGDPRAAYTLASWYVNAFHVPRNVRKARRLFTVAAKARIPEAIYNLGVTYDLGDGVAKNLRRAFEHYLEAALLGDADATFEVGRCYRFGFGVTKDAKLARIWTRRGKELERSSEQ